MAHIVTQPCCKDAGCVAVCPVDCIHPTPTERLFRPSEMLYIDPEKCIDCGACVDECPVDAIVPPEDITPGMQPFVEINAAYYQDNPVPGPDPEPQPIEVKAAPGVLRVAIVGSGPSASYLAESLVANRRLPVEISILERLPVPGGLVRFGVAPDHPSTKEVASGFLRTMGRKNVDIFLGVEVGTHLTHDDLLRHHHAVVYASGTSGDRALNVPGEDMPGSVSAREFVAWYNGHPDHANQRFDLSCERAVIVGNGNVALDVARILSSDVSRLLKTDIAAHALEALAASRIREVVVLGRRGPAHAAFSTPELLGLTDLPGVSVTASHAFVASTALDRIRADILTRCAAEAAVPGDRRIHLQFLRSPVEVLGTERVEGLRVSVDDPETDGGVEDVAAGLVLRSIGFRGSPIPSVPFDAERGTIPHRAGAVVESGTGAPVSGVYTAGWIKRGPSGVIGSNKSCSAETAASIVSDFVGGRLREPQGGRQSFSDFVDAVRPGRIDLQGWRRIDSHEKSAGRAVGRPRVKLVDRDEMVSVALGEAVAAR
ncbi:ferredoxin--NADP+ reductase [Rhodococcus pyridinivorans]|uniref:4Fe-4S binding protein n=1 Tax=Rhodococcus pyridinivorans TaxID=103816 RepID=UPI0007CD4F22|nr:4Fe-4S binding protein [Rhodococcus pyridinivorans]SEC12103.1 ferredoxin--NADP+ reductase [Rhodococcus pyridinivorans]